MAFSRKHLGSGLVTDSETTLYTPSGSTVGVIGKLTFFNESTTSPVKITVYSPHSGSAATGDYLAEETIQPRRSWVCRESVNEVIPSSEILSAVASVTNLVSYSVAGGEE